MTKFHVSQEASKKPRRSQVENRLKDYIDQSLNFVSQKLTIHFYFAFETKLIPLVPGDLKFHCYFCLLR